MQPWLDQVNKLKKANKDNLSIIQKAQLLEQLVNEYASAFKKTSNADKTKITNIVRNLYKACFSYLENTNSLVLTHLIEIGINPAEEKVILTDPNDKNTTYTVSKLSR